MYFFKKKYFKIFFFEKTYYEKDILLVFKDKKNKNVFNYLYNFKKKNLFIYDFFFSKLYKNLNVINIFYNKKYSLFKKIFSGTKH
jgi:hypothetical protein